ncbi:GxxExxY protein [Chryseobacterium sp. Alg-005]|uniref:GxxExxY protein n=1 Tax=Chryseobacterium sp. Alg-005 TaxID=3159516 RepID=UPI0035558460
MKENEISFYVRKSIFSVYNELGPGLLEKVYEKVLVHELQNNGLKVRSQVPMNIKFKDVFIDSSFITDIIVEDKVIIEVKAVTEINNIHHQQLLTYLKLTGLKLGILVNFNTDYIDKSIFRKVNGKLDW